MKSNICGVLRDDDAAALIEYTLIMFIISVAAIAALNLIGGNTTGSLNTSANAIVGP